MDNNAWAKEQHKMIQTRKTAAKISGILVDVKLKDTTFSNLIIEGRMNNDEFYSALDWLAKNKKIFFLVTAEETYVLPAG